MLNFKHLSFVHPSLFNLFFSEYSSSKSKKEDFSNALDEWIRISNGVCGVLTLSFDGGKSLEEISSVGYGEDGFFYSFLSRPTGNLDRLNSSPDFFPFWFSSTEYDLFHPNSVGCLVGAIRGDFFLEGFFLVEFLEKPSDAIITLWALLSKIMSEGPRSNISVLRAHSSSSIRTDFKKEGIGEFLAEACGILSLPDWLKSKNSWVRISGPSGSGKKTLGKWLHRSLSPEKGILVIGFLPEQISKLEKSLDEWIRMTDSGSILIEGTEKFSSIHQKFFFKLLSEGTVDSRLIFTETQGVESFEIFKPFREFLLQRTIFIPSLDSFHSPQINSLVQLILEELKESMGREDLRLSEKNLQKILTMNFDKNLSSLRNLLEESILSSSGSEIEILDRKEIRDRILTIPDSEDLDLRTAVEAVERQKILLAQKLFGGNQIRMARALGISRGSLQYKLKQLEIG
ncbi:transcriptional regulator, Fis family [Leptospira interrogans serovar Valbuzzi str. Duyster]|uniref:helix-turn-helix domain-containing protein n=1 Tax=Leptospira interrogans TaxID=173 RepID=UPI0002BB2497|nr:helix-turn-helix domain-containing protein [Leptospira interrogans]EMJ55990.1 transcriptional regulator, Fis family [Leptospira interrogans serovar Valbuzzi str. Duyster]ENO70704.1 transcriptional regulator, Fis family [Leptospira interrogans serovar Valbuzzi str. Valbuzzi]